MKTLIVGNGGREAALAWKMAENSQLYAFMGHANPSIIDYVKKSGGEWSIGNTLDGDAVAAFAVENQIDLAFVSSDAALEAGVVDSLKAAGIKTAGPTREGAQIEWDKTFSRALTSSVCPEFNPEFYVASNLDEAVTTIKQFGERGFAIKPAGLTGGKGVKVTGVNIEKEEALAYARELYASGHNAVIFEEKIEGIEFTLQAITDGKTVIFPPATYDYPYRFDKDEGPNTGGMGVYSDVTKNLPFMTPELYHKASEVTQRVVDALREHGRDFNGVLNGGFFLTKQGELKIIEFNARFGDPECMNIMSLMEDNCDWVKILNKIAEGNLDPEDVKFKQEASALVYLVAPEYASSIAPPPEGHSFRVDTKKIDGTGCRIFFASAVAGEAADEFRTVGTSRSVAIVSTAVSIDQARENVMSVIQSCIEGQLNYRSDIASSEYIEHTKLQLQGAVSRIDDKPLNVPKPS